MTTIIDESKPARLDIRHWSWRRFILALLVIFPIFGAVAWFIADADVHRKVNQRPAEYRSKGIPVSREQIAVEIVPDGENQVFYIQRAMEALQISPGEIAHLDNFPRPRIENNLDFYDQFFLKNEPVFQHLAEAQQRKRASWNLEIESTEWPDMRAAWRVCQLLDVSARVAALNGDHRTAMIRLEQLRLMAAAMEKHPTLIGHMQSASMKSLVCDSLISISEKISISDASEGPAASRDQATRMVEWLLNEDEHRAAMIQWYRRQRVYAITLLHSKAQTGRLGRYRHDARLLRMMDKFDLAERTALLQSLPEAMKELPPNNERRAINADDFDVPIEGSVQVDFRSRLKRRAAAIALAVALYRQDHQGNWPTSLEDLIPTYLPAMPDDPLAFPIKPFSFLPGRYLIYSVGLNGVDDGGSDQPQDPQATRANGHLNEWQRRDVLIYLVPPPAEEE